MDGFLPKTFGNVLMCENIILCKVKWHVYQIRWNPCKVRMSLNLDRLLPKFRSGFFQAFLCFLMFGSICIQTYPVTSHMQRVTKVKFFTPWYSNCLACLLSKSAWLAFQRYVIPADAWGFRLKILLNVQLKEKGNLLLIFRLDFHTIFGSDVLWKDSDTECLCNRLNGLI